MIETIRPGVQFAPEAAASFRRAEAGWLAKTGRLIDCNSSYRDYGLQLSMWQAWTAWVEGRGPKPNHSRALHPDASVHCQGRALDSDDWSTPGFIEHMAEHGWIRTAAWDPTERHHFEYQADKDQHRYDPAPAGLIEEDDMTPEQARQLDEARDNAVHALKEIKTTKVAVGRIEKARARDRKVLDHVSNTATHALAEAKTTKVAVGRIESRLTALDRMEALVNALAEKAGVSTSNE